MPRVTLDKNVFDAALDRMIECYQRPENYPVVSFSAGKDSGICLELAIIAADQAGRLPVDVVMRDEEVMFPGTFEYAERMARRPEVRMHWVIARQPVVNNFNRKAPYFWVFDELVPPADWVRLPPDFVDAIIGADADTDTISSALTQPCPIPVNTKWTPPGWTNQGYVKFIEEKYIEAITVRTRFAPYITDNQTVFDTVGLRGQESFMRLRGVYASGGHLTKANRYGTRKIRPIYDWTDGDVWKAILDNGWDYNQAYNVMLRMGTSRASMRIAPPTMNPAGAAALQKAARAWPRWFDRVARRLPGSRAVAQFGKKVLTPERRSGESWQSCFERECIDKAPDWIAARATYARDSILKTHAYHDNTGILPEIAPCQRCSEFGSWQHLATYLYLGDPFSQKAGSLLPVIEPEFFREGAGTWGGTPTFS